MKVSVTGIPLSDLDIDLLVVPVAEDDLESIYDTAREIWGELPRSAMNDFTGKPGSSVLLYPCRGKIDRVALTGLGPARKIDAEVLRRASAEGAKLALQCKVETACLLVPDSLEDTETASQALVEGFMLASYRFDRYKSPEKNPSSGITRLVLHAKQEDRISRRGVERGRIIAESVSTARDLVNLSPDEKTPELFAKSIERSAKKHGYSADIWDKKLIEEEKMGGLLAVNRGSQEAPAFAVLTWRPEHAINERPIVLVGKGVVFDTGGLSLKPTKDSMDFMKSDMAGAAAVVGTFEAAARLELPVYLVGLIPITDNRPGERAFVPGDVLRMHSGKTVEVLNTDAEGRLILADALSYARTYKPELTIDLATLTGAAVVALGSETAAVMTNDADSEKGYFDAILKAGQITGDRVHPMPMYDEYARSLESDVADLKNVGGREAGAITAAKFLEHFVSYPWIHIDIAGPAFLQKEDSYRLKGGTGFGVRLLIEFLRGYINPRKRR